MGADGVPATFEEYLASVLPPANASAVLRAFGEFAAASAAAASTSKNATEAGLSEVEDEVLDNYSGAPCPGTSGATLEGQLTAATVGHVLGLYVLLGFGLLGAVGNVTAAALCCVAKKLGSVFNQVLVCNLAIHTAYIFATIAIQVGLNAFFVLWEATFFPCDARYKVQLSAVVVHLRPTRVLLFCTSMSCVTLTVSASLSDCALSRDRES